MSDRYALMHRVRMFFVNTEFPLRDPLESYKAVCAIAELQRTRQGNWKARATELAKDFGLLYGT
jgi:hypothetical protein